MATKVSVSHNLRVNSFMDFFYNYSGQSEKLHVLVINLGFDLVSLGGIPDFKLSAIPATTRIKPC